VKKTELKLYTDRKGTFRWALVAANGKTLADSGEGYASKAKAKRAFKTVKALVAAMEA
jgi:uncharacterized protein YegP (UPF0339 family)